MKRERERTRRYPIQPVGGGVEGLMTLKSEMENKFLSRLIMFLICVSEPLL